MKRKDVSRTASLSGVTFYGVTFHVVMFYGVTFYGVAFHVDTFHSVGFYGVAFHVFTFHVHASVPAIQLMPVPSQRRLKSDRRPSEIFNEWSNVRRVVFLTHLHL